MHDPLLVQSLVIRGRGCGGDFQRTFGGVCQSGAVALEGEVAAFGESSADGFEALLGEGRDVGCLRAIRYGRLQDTVLGLAERGAVVLALGVLVWRWSKWEGWD